jgi:two-component system chemotaxis sensor kinase CheA
MVEERTQELKEANDFMALMVNSLDQGLVVFDNKLNCHPMFTKACEPMFGVSPLNKTILEVLDITEEEKVKTLEQWADIVFKELIPFESAANLGPKQKVSGTTYTDPDYKFVKLDYYPMRDSDKKISNVVLIATDKTKEVQATDRAIEKEAYVSMILKILNNKTQFEAFITEVESICDQFKKAYSLKEKTIEFDLCMMLFHTLNGGFGIYTITHMQKLAQKYEAEINSIKDSVTNPTEYINTLVGNVENLKNEFHKFKLDLDNLIGTKFVSNQSFTEIPREKILEFKNIVHQTGNKNLEKFYNDNFIKVPIINYFRAYDDLCKTSAVKINKKFDGLIFNNEDLKIDAEPLQEFFNVLVHLFRNCLDHGLEDSYTREQIGKSPEGHITVSFNEITSQDKNFLSIIVQDDGAGINPQIIKERFMKLKPDEDISGLTDKEIILKIFDPFFSTRDEVSALSGRGVGMSAIKEVVDRLNGQIEIETRVGRGSEFSFLIPMS